ncbi:MAG TPA: hypothetical protein VD788_17865 [Candidatus Polarisedimenticolaceae bacterium]|nr:hypothetical protein [Candidatus Polarisedimenticolaceae bacterium]
MGGRGFHWLLIALCTMLAIVVILLARQNAELKRELLARPAVELSAGDVLDEIVVVAHDGVERPLELTGPTLLLVFSSRCPACAALRPYWSELPALAGPGALQIIGLETDAAGSTALAPYPIYAVVHDRSPGLEPVPYVPATVLVDGDKTVRRVWFGPLDAEARRELTELIRG